MLRTASGKKASPASVARLHEYHEWLDARASDRCDDSWKAFMAERRSSQEKARLRKLGVQRTATRYCAATGRAAPTDAAQLAHMGAALRAQRQQGEHERREQRKATGATENAAGPRYRIRRGLEPEFDDWCDQVGWDANNFKVYQFFLQNRSDESKRREAARIKAQRAAARAILARQREICQADRASIVAAMGEAVTCDPRC